MLFSEFIEGYRSGTLDQILGMELQKVVDASQKHAKVGQLKIAITLKPKSVGETEISIKFDKKLPARDRLDSIMFVTPEGNLVGDDPNQPKLFDRVDGCLVDQETGEVITPTKTIKE
jgi:hypothetical protein